MLLASYVGLILIALLIVFTLAQRARPRIAARIPSHGSRCCRFAIVIFPHLAWLKGARDLVVSGLDDKPRGRRMPPGVWLCVALVLSHLGLGLLVAFASGWPRRRDEAAPVIDRNPIEPLARAFVYFFALTPAHNRGRRGLCQPTGSDRSTAWRRWWCSPASRLWSPPATACSLYRERMVSSTWLGLLVAPPALIVLGLRAAAVDLHRRPQGVAAGQCGRPLLCR